MGDWDKSLKTLVMECPQAFAEWIMRETGLTVISLLPTELKGYDLVADGLLMLARHGGEEVVLLVEIQSVNDKEMGERLLEYSFRARRIHKRPVIACVIFLRKDGEVPEPPLVWEFRDGKKILVFDYTCIKLWELEAEELLAFHQLALLPLTLMTKRGANRTIVERMFASLIENKLENLLPASNLLASLALGEGDLEWLQRRYQKMTDILKDAPAYRWMTDDAREEERQEQLKELRETIMAIIEGRFPKYARFAKKQVLDATDTRRLNHLIVQLSLAQKTEDIEQYLLDIDEEEGQVTQ
jgi:predicted transposase YdaD